MNQNQWYKLILALLVPCVIALGWKYPYIGFTVPIVMLTGMIGGIIRGRWVCGNLCPRGAFFDKYLFFARKNPLPLWVKNIAFRWILFGVLMAFMAYRISLAPANIEHWGKVFWLMCTLTTAIGIIGAYFFNARFWCAVCPVGTFGNTIGGSKKPLTISSNCRECGICAQKCPMLINPAQFIDGGFINDRDCIRCNKCVNACPQKAISKL